MKNAYLKTSTLMVLAGTLILCQWQALNGRTQEGAGRTKADYGGTGKILVPAALGSPSMKAPDKPNTLRRDATAARRCWFKTEGAKQYAQYFDGIHCSSFLFDYRIVSGAQK